MGAMFFLQFNINNSEIGDWKTVGVKEKIFWCFIEVGTLYLSIFSGIIYLLYISLRGALGLIK